MKHIFIYLISAFLLMAGITSCKKTVDSVKATSSLTFFNALTDGTYIFPRFNHASNISFQDRNFGIADLYAVGPIPIRNVSLPAGRTSLDIFAFPDSISPARSKMLDLQPGGIYSCFTFGTRTDVDTLFTRDEVSTPPKSDSLIMIRFVNLAKGLQPLSIHGADGPVVPSMGDLPYRTITKFQTFSVKKAQHAQDYIDFEIRDAITQKKLTKARYTWNFPAQDGGGTHFISKGATAILVRSADTVSCKIINPYWAN